MLSVILGKSSGLRCVSKVVKNKEIGRCYANLSCRHSLGSSREEYYVANPKNAAVTAV